MEDVAHRTDCKPLVLELGPRHVVRKGAVRARRGVLAAQAVDRFVLLLQAVKWFDAAGRRVRIKPFTRDVTASVVYVEPERSIAQLVLEVVHGAWIHIGGLDDDRAHTQRPIRRGASR